MNNYSEETEIRPFLKIFISYVLSCISFGIGFFLLFQTYSFIGLLFALKTNKPWNWNNIQNGINIFSIIVLGIFWMVMAFLTQYWYERDLKNKWYFKRFLLITSLQFLIMFIIKLIIYIVIPNLYSTLNFTVMMLFLIAGMIFMFLYFRADKNNVK